MSHTANHEVFIMQPFVPNNIMLQLASAKRKEVMLETKEASED